MNILSNLKINIELRLRIFNRTFLPKKVTLHLQGESSTWKQACVRFLNRILFFLSAWKTLKYSVLWLILGSFNKVSTSKLLETFSHNLKGTFTEIVTFGPGKCFVLYENNFILHNAHKTLLLIQGLKSEWLFLNPRFDLPCNRLK